VCRAQRDGLRARRAALRAGESAGGHADGQQGPTYAAAFRPQAQGDGVDVFSAGIGPTPPHGGGRYEDPSLGIYKRPVPATAGWWAYPSATRRQPPLHGLAATGVDLSSSAGICSSGANLDAGLDVADAARRPSADAWA
jgi:hypothetical protein